MKEQPINSLDGNGGPKVEEFIQEAFEAYWLY
jgi:hypothetical protein